MFTKEESANLVQLYGKWNLVYNYASANFFEKCPKIDVLSSSVPLKLEMKWGVRSFVNSLKQITLKTEDVQKLFFVTGDRKPQLCN